MNFYGHAWVAAWFSEQEPFILGSMLPDFANMLRVAAPVTRHHELGAGVRLHHATDAVFHRATTFCTLERDARGALEALGVSKGARRALAHIGVEFLIDEQLGARAPSWPGYARALRFGGSEACTGALDWGPAGTGELFAALCRRLAASASRRADDAVLAARLVACLAGRPRLELTPAEAERLEPWLAACRPTVIELMPELLAELARELDAPASRRHAELG
jgi:hypothetical protein